MTPPLAQEQLMEPVGFDPFAQGELALTIPLTEPQKEIWTSAQMGKEANCSFNESVSLVLRGPLEVGHFQEAFQRSVGRHEALRMTFSPEGDWACVKDRLDLEIPLKDLSGLAREERDRELARLLEAEVESPFDLVKGPLVRVAIIRLESRLHQVLITAHHIVCDGWSTDVLVADLAQIYSALVKGREPNLKPVDLFSEYVSTLALPDRLRAAQEDRDYWLGQYAVKPPVVDLPTDRPRPALRTYQAGRLDWEVPGELIQKLKDLGTRTGCTFLNVLLSGFAAFIHRLSGQDDIVIGLPAAGQSIEGKESLVGHCVHLLPLRFRLNKNTTFKEYLSTTKTIILDSHDHQRVTLGDLIPRMKLDRDPSRVPLVPVSFNLDQGIDLAGMKFAGLENDLFSNFRKYKNFEFGINISICGDRYVCECAYNSDLWERETVVRRIDEFGVFLAGLAKDPDQRITHASLLPPEEEEQILALGKGPDLEIPGDLTVIDRFEQQVGNNPDKVALQHAGITLTYGRLNGMANRLAQELMDSDIGPGVKVGLCVKRSPAIVIGILGILKSGAAYVPLDPGLPAKRIAYLIDDCELPLVLADSGTAKLIRAADRPGVEIYTDWAENTGRIDRNQERRAGPSDLMYVMYTSGSTGQPKGVMISHGSLMAFLYSVDQFYKVRPGDRVLQFVSYWWDPSVMDIFTTLLNGARLVLRNEEMIGSPARFFEFCDKYKITMFLLPTAYLNLLGPDLENIEIPERLQLVSCVGEAMGPESAAAWRRKLDPRAALINLYGPTECSVTCTWHQVELTEAAGPVPIGLPTANSRLYILDRHLNLCPLGFPGELHIGGPLVGLGYLNKPDLTAEQFIADPFSPDKGARLYKTGDIFRYRNDGLLEILDRVDHQVKIRGYRIELGEIRAAFVGFQAVRDVFLTVREDVPGNKNLTAYLVPATGWEIDIQDLRTFLRDKLPSYMVPADFVIMDRLPITSGGKIDRKALPAPREEGDMKSFTRPQTNDEIFLAGMFAKILKQPKVGRNDNFFELGGNSLLAVRLVSRLEKEIGKSLLVTTIFDAPTVKKLAARLNLDAGDMETPLLVKIKSGAARRPFFHIGQVDSRVRTFAGHLDITNPVYLLHVQPLDQKAPLFTDVNVIADYCLAEMKKIQPQGPYLISGFCLGGFVAYEIARRLRSQGEEVPYLALIESYLPEAVQTRQDLGKAGLIRAGWRFYCSQWQGKGPVSYLHQLGAKCFGFGWYYICNLAFSLFGGLKRKVPGIFNNELVALARARSGYDPKPYPGRAFIFRATEVGPWLDIEPGLGWGRYIKEEVREIMVPGCHSTIYDEPQVREFAKLLGNTLKLEA